MAVFFDDLVKRGNESIRNKNVFEILFEKQRENKK